MRVPFRNIGKDSPSSKSSVKNEELRVKCVFNVAKIGLLDFWGGSNDSWSGVTKNIVARQLNNFRIYVSRPSQGFKMTLRYASHSGFRNANAKRRVFRTQVT